MATAIPMPTGENVTFISSRRMEQGPFERASAERLDETRPHLARSVLISARLQLERARVAGEALAALGVSGSRLQRDWQGFSHQPPDRSIDGLCALAGL
jgi:hypothetical protein